MVPANRARENGQKPIEEVPLVQCLQFSGMVVGGCDVLWGRSTQQRCACDHRVAVDDSAKSFL